MEDIQSQDQISQVSIEDLPPEMLEMIFKNLDAPSLFACRLVCRKWRVISTRILHGRPETEIFFDVQSNSVFGLEKADKNFDAALEKKEKSLTDFKECLNNSDETTNLFVQFSLFNIKKWDESIIKFLSLVSPIATCLKLQFARSAMADPGLSEKLKNLLLHETPVLKEFGIRFERKDVFAVTQNQMGNLERDSKALKLKLFSSSKENLREDNSTTNDPILNELPKLKVLHIGLEVEDDSSIGVFRDILKISPNVERIYYLDIDPNDMAIWDFDQNDLLFFLEHGKLYALQNVSFEPTPKFLSAWKNETAKITRKKTNVKLEISSLFKIKFLELSFDEISSSQIQHPNPHEMREALRLAEEMLEGSKNILEKLYISSLSFPPGFSFPTFTKLSTVKFYEYEDEETHTQFCPLFPPGCRSLNIFPAVKTLSLSVHVSNNLKHFFPREDSIPLMPSVHTLIFKGEKTSGESVRIMTLLCPNLKHLKRVNIYDEDDTGGLEDFPSFGQGVWRHMKNLESLPLVIDASTETNSFPALDSTFTAISHRIHIIVIVVTLIYFLWDFQGKLPSII